MPFAILFEVMDKELSFEFLVAASLGFGGAAFFLGRKNPLLAIPFALLLGAFFALFHSEVNDPQVGPQIVAEAGIGYVRYGYVFLTIGSVLSVAGVIEWIVKRFRKSGLK